MPQNKQNNNNKNKKGDPSRHRARAPQALTLKLCQVACHLTAFILGQLTLTGY